MAELTVLESKLAEAFGLAQAAQGATKKAQGMLDEDEHVQERHLNDVLEGSLTLAAQEDPSTIEE